MRSPGFLDIFTGKEVIFAVWYKPNLFISKSDDLYIYQNSKRLCDIIDQDFILLYINKLLFC